MNAATVACRQLGFDGAALSSGRALFGGGSKLQPVHLKNVQCTGFERRLVDCRSENVWRKTNCSHGSGVGVVCSRVDEDEDGDIRLVGNMNGRGRPEIFYNNHWGRLCTTSWQFNDAVVICGELGFLSATITNGPSLFGRVNDRQPFYAADFRCSGRETHFKECFSSRLRDERNCSNFQDIGIVCGKEAREGSVRLVGGSTPHEGRVEIMHRHEWSTICGHSWDIRDAMVVCRELGLGPALAARQNAGRFGEGARHQYVLRHMVMCKGKEGWLRNCPQARPAGRAPSCGHKFHAGVECMARPKEKGDVRLVGGTTAAIGRIEIFHNSEWGTVCDDSWGMNDAEVVCRQLGYSGGAIRYADNAEFGQGDRYQPVWLDNVGCTGREEKLMYCSHRGWGNTNCLHSEDAGVVCDTSSGYEGQVRLAGSSVPYNGRVEIYHSGVWGTVCNDRWGSNEARVVCRQLGYPGVYDSHTYYGQGTGPIHLDDVVCSGYESELSDCLHDPWGQHNCDHSEDTGVRCSTYSKYFFMAETWYAGLADISDRDQLYLFFVLVVACIGTVCSSKKKRKQRTQAVDVRNAHGMATVSRTADVTLYPSVPPAGSVAQPPPSYTATMAPPTQPPAMMASYAYPPPQQ
ncbi:scavenger receptor cysteine-rich domain-containing protein DMBT1-like [Diadema antillarum]|uniref:scavenger receptor cysteine-rich domain-containing protein DMBT1-like n=1 Tax=Diadema antillarum TaxID=105358 RepID=UPI003A8635C6